MEKSLYSQIQNLSLGEIEWKQLRVILQKEELNLQKNLNVVEEVLNALDPTNNSLGYIYLLAIKSSSPKLDVGKFFNQVSKFLLVCSGPQIRLVPNKVSQVCRKFSQLSIENNQPLRAIKPLHYALDKLRLNNESFTPIHADFVQVCVSAKAYSYAVPILEEDIYDVNSDSSAVARDFLLYSYLGGLTYVGLKEYKKALSFFKMAISIPAIALSAIMSESLKKFILLSLLVHGRILTIPKYSSSLLLRHFKTSLPQYQEFANAYSTTSTDELHKVAQQYVEVFTKDKNFGLIKQCIQSLYRRNVQRLTQTYITLSLQDIATTVKLKSPQEAEEFIVRMTEKGEIFATINQKDGMVSFHEDPESYDTTGVLNSLDQRIQKAIEIGKKARDIDESISCSKLYLQKTTQERVGRSGWELEDFMESEKGMMGPIMGAPASSGGPGKMM
jgi:COP9 signalosome complex subunit 3